MCIKYIYTHNCYWQALCGPLQLLRSKTYCAIKSCLFFFFFFFEGGGGICSMLLHNRTHFPAQLEGKKATKNSMALIKSKSIKTSSLSSRKLLQLQPWVFLPGELGKGLHLGNNFSSLHYPQLENAYQKMEMGLPLKGIILCGIYSLP